MSARPYVSIVVPLYNEEESLGLLYEKIREAGESIGRPWEAIFVDDGSRDRTYDLVREIHARDPRIKAVKLRKNYGQTSAMVAGFEHTRGDVVISMDGDLQNDPADIPRLLAKLEEGFDVVCGWRKDRQDKLISRRVPSVVANWIIGRVTGVRIHDNGCSLKAYRGELIRRVSLYNELHRFIPAMSTLAGARITELVVNHHARQFGVSKYGLGRVWRVFLDIIGVKMITGFSSRPALGFALVSLPCLLIGSAILAAGAAMFLGRSDEQWMTTATAGFLMLFLGVQVLTVGVVAELALRTGSYSPARLLGPVSETEMDDDEDRASR